MSLTFFPESRAFFAVSSARVIFSRASARETFGLSPSSSSSNSCRRVSDGDAAMTVEAWVAIGGLGGRASAAGGGGGDRTSVSSVTMSMPVASRAAARYFSASRRLLSFIASFSRSLARAFSSSRRVVCNPTNDSCWTADSF